MTNNRPQKNIALAKVKKRKGNFTFFERVTFNVNLIEIFSTLALFPSRI